MFSASKDSIDVSKYYKKLQNEKDLDALIDKIGDSKYVLLGEASHGTHEYYTWRAKISQRLIKEKGFSFIAVEGDWPDCYKINKWIKNFADSPENIHEVLQEFNRWPTWMWANWEVTAFTTWLKDYNSTLPESKKIGFYGLDVYSLWDSMQIMLTYLEKEDPDTAELAKQAYRCFEPYEESDSYASVFRHSKEGCKEQVIKLLKQVRERVHEYDIEKEAALNAEINTLVMANAENYYHAMADLADESWNVRDRHMVETLDILMAYHPSDAKAIVWEHNTHVGDARATDMASGGLVNIGQLVRENHSEDGVHLVGFGSFKGSVIAGRAWGAPMREMEVPEAIEGSIEYRLHQEGNNNKILFLDEPPLKERFSARMGHRAIGVIYHPERERGNYVPTKLSDRYDTFIFLDETKALHPLIIKTDTHVLPETYPFGI